MKPTNLALLLLCLSYLFCENCVAQDGTKLGQYSSKNRFYLDTIDNIKGMQYYVPNKDKIKAYTSETGLPFTLTKTDAFMGSNVYFGSWKGKSGRWLEFFYDKAKNTSLSESYVLLSDVRNIDKEVNDKIKNSTDEYHKALHKEILSELLYRLVYLLGFVAILLFMNFLKKRFSRSALLQAQNYFPIGGVELIKIIPYEHREVDYFASGYSGTVNTTTGQGNMYRTYSRDAEIFSGWIFVVKNIGQEFIRSTALGFELYDRYGSITEGLSGWKEIYDIRPGEKRLIQYYLNQNSNIRLKEIRVIISASSYSKNLDVSIPKINLPIIEVIVPIIITVLCYNFITENGGMMEHYLLTLAAICLAVAVISTLRKNTILWFVIIPTLIFFCSDIPYLVLIASVYYGIIWFKRYSFADFISSDGLKQP